MDLPKKNKDREYSRIIPSKLFNFVLLVAITTIGVSAADCKIQANKILMPRYPAAALALRVSDEIKVSVSISTDGSVLQAKAISGSKWLRTVSEKSALNWQFRAYPVTSKCFRKRAMVHFSYVLLPKNTAVDENTWSLVEFPNRVVVKAIMPSIEIDNDSSPSKKFEDPVDPPKQD